MSTAFIQIWNLAVPSSQWTPLVCPVVGSCLKAWFQFDGDLHLRSDPENATTDYLAQIAKGNQFDIPVTGPVTMDGTRPVVYLQGANGTVNVVLFCLMQ